MNSYSDDRGKLAFCNEFDFSRYKRFYIVSPKSVGQVRAWQGHLLEEKVFFSLKGRIKLVVVPILNFESKYFGDPEEFILDAKLPQLIHLPGGFVNGFQFLDSDAELMIFSNFNVSESQNDDLRFEASRFYHW